MQSIIVKFQTGLALLLTGAWVLFLVVGSQLSAFPAGEQITEEQFAEPGFVVDGKTLILGASHRGSDLLSDLVSATWFNTWVCAISSVLSLALSYCVWRIVVSRMATCRVFGLLFLWVSCGLTLFVPFVVLLFVRSLNSAAPLPLVLLLAYFAFPVGVQFFSMMNRGDRPFGTKIRCILTFGMRRWAALHMLIGLVGFLVSVRTVWPGDLIHMFRDNATLILFGDWTPWLIGSIYTAIAICLRLWASVLEARWSIAPIRMADSWVYLPAMLEGALREAETGTAASASKPQLAN